MKKTIFNEYIGKPRKPSYRKYKYSIYISSRKTKYKYYFPVFPFINTSVEVIGKGILNVCRCESPYKRDLERFTFLGKMD